MRPFFFSYKSISISWYMFFTLVSASFGYIMASILATEYREKKDRIQDIYLILLIVGFIGARFGYALRHPDLYRDNIFSLFKLSHYNLSFLGGILSGLIALISISRIYGIAIEKLLSIFTTAFYLSMAIGIWVLRFDRLMLSLAHFKILLLSLVFLVGMVLELALGRRFRNKYTSITILLATVFAYYILI